MYEIKKEIIGHSKQIETLKQHANLRERVREYMELQRSIAQVISDSSDTYVPANVIYNEQTLEKNKLKTKNNNIILNLLLVGSTHLLDIREQLISIILRTKPDVICVELDINRYKLIQNLRKYLESLNKQRKKEDKKEILLMRLMGTANLENCDMVVAMSIAEKNGIPIALIDMDFNSIFAQTKKEMSFFEKIKLFFWGVSTFNENRRILKNSEGTTKTRLKNSESVYLGKQLRTLSEQCPKFKNALVDKRNLYMAEQIKMLSKHYKRVLVVVGMAHVDGIKKFLKDTNLNIEVTKVGIENTDTSSVNI